MMTKGIPRIFGNFAKILRQTKLLFTANYECELMSIFVTYQIDAINQILNSLIVGNERYFYLLYIKYT